MDDFVDVYSYSRISHPSQITGFGLQRQDERIDAYLAARPRMRLVQRMQDICSGWSGLHRSKGTFGAFEKLVSDGLIRPGSHLILDKLDRLTRQDTDVALELMLKLIRKRIVIVTLSDGMEYTSTMGRQKRFEGLFKALMSFELAGEESSKKSDNHLDNWAKKTKSNTRHWQEADAHGSGMAEPARTG